MNPKISIIVPVYKVEPYIHKCINSLLDQTFTDYELILINDGSPDQCGEICDHYATVDSRIKVIHKENGGQASARNTGLEIAKGDYIGFVDSDDYIDNDMLEVLINNAMKFEAEVVECGINIVNGDKIHQIQNNIQVEFGDNIFALKGLLNNGYRNSVCNKLYKKEIFNELRFPNKLYEDGFLAFKIYYLVKKYVFIGESKYNYVQRNESTMSKQENFTLRNLDGFECDEERYHFIKERVSEQSLLTLSESYFFNRILFFYQKLLNNKEIDPYKKYRNDLKNKIVKNYQDFLVNPNLKKFYLLVMSSKLNINRFNFIFTNYMSGLNYLLRTYSNFRKILIIERIGSK
ncbi:glycosyltransferase family 2 protein [Bacillus sp. AFS017336]|uniref:glycosyltransferase family 2 protein n=1 Tax=Bacillus sp. AFS017336 TaxID=2033489 RepID=UPI0015CF35F3|nr:glycosyltransferase family 2 protein [Bacillus sp. AFS017336]